MTRRRLLVGVLAIAAAGCSADPRSGYSTNSLYPTEVATISIPIFTNETYVRDVEHELTDALIKSIEGRTGYKVVPSSRADSILEGRIVEVSLDQLSKSRETGLGEEVVLSVTIDFTWKRLDGDRVLMERKSFTGNGLFLPSNPYEERIELGRFAAVQQLADDIVDEMQAAW